MADRIKGFADVTLEEFGERIVKLARINLGRTYTAKRSNGKSYRKRIERINLGRTYTAKRSNGKSYRKRIDSSGKLRKSLGYNLLTRGEDGRFISGRLEFTMLEYGKFVDQGRKKGKGIPSAPLEKWIKQKPLRLRDLESGGFVRMTDAKVKSVAYLISRNAKKHGIEPTNFISEPIENEFPKLSQSLAESLGDDYLAAVANAID